VSALPRSFACVNRALISALATDSETIGYEWGTISSLLDTFSEYDPQQTPPASDSHPMFCITVIFGLAAGALGYEA
jgi:hypothetical protein